MEEWARVYKENENWKLKYKGWPVLQEVKLICNLLSTHQFVKELQLLRQICPKRVYLNIVKMHLLGSKTSLSLEDVN